VVTIRKILATKSNRTTVIQARASHYITVLRKCSATNTVISLLSVSFTWNCETLHFGGYGYSFEYPYISPLFWSANVFYCYS